MDNRSPLAVVPLLLLACTLVAGGACNPVDRGGWTKETVDVPGDLYAVHAFRADRVLAVGDGATTLANVDGTWRPRNLGGTEPLRAIFGMDETDVMIAGGATGRGLVWRTNEGFFRYTAQTLPNGTGALYAVHGTSMRDVWAVGDGPSIIHFDGTTWSPSPVTLPAGLLEASLRGIHCTADNACLAAGTQGVLAQWDGARWTTSVAGNGVNLHAVDHLNDAWLVGGEGGLLLRVEANGTVSEQESPESGRAVLAFFVAGGNDAWAVGAVPYEAGQPAESGQAVVMRLEGTSAWRVEDGLKADHDLTGIHGLGGQLWAVGRGGLLFRSSK